MRVLWRFGIVFGALLAATLPIGTSAVAQDVGADSPDCALLSRDQVAAALGAPVDVIMGDQYGCSWTTNNGAADAHVTSSISMATVRSSWADGAELTIGDHPAYYVTEADRLWVDLGGPVLSVELVGADVPNEQAVLSGLAQLALAALAQGIPTPPAASTAPATGLLAKFPSTVGGKPVATQLVPADQVASLLTSGAPGMAAFLAAITAQGKTPADVEEAIGIAGDGSVLLAVEVHGADAAPLAPFFATLLSGAGSAPTQETVAGKSTWVTQMGESGRPAHVYPSGDIVWDVQAVDPGLSEILAFLP